MFASAIPRTATESGEELELLVDIASAVNTTRSVAETLRHALERICAFLGWPVGHALLVAPDDERLISVDVWWLQDEERFDPFRSVSADLEFSRGVGLPGAALSGKRSQLIVDLGSEHRFIRRDVALAVGLRTGLAVPILALDRVVGVLELFDEEPSSLDARDISVLEHVGIMLGRSIERERAASAILEREKALREAQRIAHLGSWRWETGVDRVEWSEELFRIYGIDPDDHVPTFAGYLARVHPEDRERVEAAVRQALAEKSGFEFDERIVRPDGEIRWLHSRGMVVLGADGEPRGLMGVCLDLTEQRLAEQRGRALLFEQMARQRAERERLRLSSLFDQAPAAIAVVDVESGRYLMANSELSGLVGRAIERGESVDDIFPASPRNALREALREAGGSGRSQTVMEVELTVGKRSRYFNFAFLPVPRRDDDKLEIMIHGVDVTELVHGRQQIEHKAAELARLASELERSNRELDQFAYVASHDLKAPLRGIANVSTWVEEDLGDAADDEIRENLRLMRDRVSRMEALIDGLLQYSRVGRSSQNAEVMDVGMVVRDVIEFLNPPDHVEFSVGPELPHLEGQPLPFRQVLQNLLANAIKYARVEKPRIEIGASDSNEHVEVWVSDNGPGIAPAHQDKIWGIFQKLESRDAVNGTGIGLALVRKIVETHGGKVWIESDLGSGASFHFTWPKTRGAVP